jgi:hypothetical protein
LPHVVGHEFGEPLLKPVSTGFAHAPSLRISAANLWKIGITQQARVNAGPDESALAAEVLHFEPI